MGETFDFSKITSTVIQDGISIAAPEIVARGRRAAAALGDAPCARVVLRTRNAATTISALLACQLADCEIVLARDNPGGEPSRDELGDAASQIGGDLTLAPLAVPAAKRGKFGILLATSGTTGAPKRALHSLARLIGGIGRPQTTDPARRWLLTYHPASFAGLQVILTALVSGAALVAVSDPSVPRLAEFALDHRPTMISGTPTFWRSFLVALGARAGSLDLSHITLGGEAVDQSTLDRLKFAFPRAAITHIYASTEAGMLFAVKDGRAGFPADWLGKDVEGVRMRIRDGILEVQSPRRMWGYDGWQTKTEAPLSGDGWLITGDRVERRKDRVMFLGRADSLINVGGMKVSPEEIETALLEVPGVADVHAYGRKNPITGFLVSADIVLDASAKPDAVLSDVAKHAKARLDAHKVPRVIRSVDRIELSETGKKARRP